VKKAKKIGLDFEVDKLTNSIENVITGDSFATEVSILTKSELKLVSKKNGWLFNWTEEYKQPEREVYKLTIVGNSTIIQGLMMLMWMQIKPNGHWIQRYRHGSLFSVGDAPLQQRKLGIRCIFRRMRAIW
jgi:hypothetical protein